MKLIKHKKYEIHWIDTNSRSGWLEEKEIDIHAKKAAILNLTVGFYIKRSNGYEIFCMSYCPVEDFNPYGVTKYIPIGTIKKIKLLK